MCCLRFISRRRTAFSTAVSFFSLLLLLPPLSLFFFCFCFSPLRRDIVISSRLPRVCFRSMWWPSVSKRDRETRPLETTRVAQRTQVLRTFPSVRSRLRSLLVRYTSNEREKRNTYSVAIPRKKYEPTSNAWISDAIKNRESESKLIVQR